MAAPEFSVHVFHNPYLPAGGRTVDAIVRVTTADGPAGEMPGVALRVWTPRRVTVRFLKQVAPAVEDLTASHGETGDQAADYPTGAWAAAESRDYHLCLELGEPARPGTEMLAARLSLIAGEASEPLTLDRGIIGVTWTDDTSLSAHVDKQVARYTGQAELAEEAGPATWTLDPRKAAAAGEKAGRGTVGRFTGRGRTTIVLALEEARMLNHNSIGTEHILLGVIRESDGVAAQVLARLGADLDRVREQVIRLLAAAPSAGVTSTSEVGSRLSAVEQRAGMAPATGDLDRQIGQARIDKGAAVTARDYARAASLRDKEKELLADKASRHQRWGAGPADPPSLAELTEQVRRLSEEIEQLRGLLRQQGRRPDEGTR
jgi:hypothetical protein